jgi:hypothetical protein
VRVRGIAIALAAFGVLPVLARAQTSPLPADSLRLTAVQSLIWQQGQTNVVELKGPVDIELDHTTLTADNAVVWISPGSTTGEQQVQIALIGHAELRQASIVRTETNLLVTARVRGEIRLIGQRTAKNDADSDLYARAAALRAGQSSSTTSVTPVPAATIAPAKPQASLPARRWKESFPAQNLPAPTSIPSPTTRPKRSVEFDVNTFDLVHTENGDLAAVFSHGLTLRYLDDKGDLLEFQAENAVLFTNLKNLQGLGKGGNLKTFISDHVLSAYFENDVRVFVTPASTSRNELRMRAERIYYEFATDRAVLTDVVFHTVDVKRQIPIFMRAQTVRQLSQGEYKADNVVLTTSAFATPSYSLAAQKAYVRTEEVPGPAGGEQVAFAAQNTFLDVFGLPIFYLPGASGTMTARGGPLRTISFVNDSNFGYGARTQWGLFESLGVPAPADLDAAYRLDYFSDRGPAGGLDARYAGGFVTETTKNPWNFLGDLHSYFVYDHGVDELGASRANEKPPDEFRGRAYLEHQHFFPDDWQLQLRLGYVSDANFLTQWFPDEFRNNLPIDESIYLKHQKDSEVFTLLAEWQPNDVVTTSEDVQEQREVERLPEIGYYRVGDSFADDHFTFFSENTAAGLDFAASKATLKQQGFFPGVEPGLPSFAYTGDPGGVTWRGDFRQEMDWPINAGPIKVVPYVFGRYTVYSQGVHAIIPAPAGKTIPPAVQISSDQNRLMAGGGVKLTTAFWKVDDSFESDLFDIHRVRHVIEPEINLFASAQSIDQSRLVIYDPNVDAVNDVQAVQVALRQRWQTKRGGPGRWRSVDFFTLDLYGDFFANQPDPRFRDPVDFRGLYFSSLPEASLPRNSFNADATWRLSDTTAILADASENLDRMKFATGSIGLAMQRGDRLSFFLGNRYIADLDSNITSVEVNYELTRKYSISASESFNFSQHKSVYYTATLYRKFDRFQAGVQVYYDQSTNQSGVGFSLLPYGLQRGLGSQSLNQLNQQQ